jgi:hypothetical protein
MPIMMSAALMTTHSSSPFEVLLRHPFIGNGGRNDDTVVDVNANVQRGVQPSAHALADRAIPRSFVSVEMDGGRLPRIEFSGCVPGLSSREIKGVALALIALNASATSSTPLMPAGLLFGVDQPDIVVPDGVALSSKAVGYKFFLLRLGRARIEHRRHPAFQQDLRSFLFRQAARRRGRFEPSGPVKML